LFSQSGAGNKTSIFGSAKTKPTPIVIEAAKPEPVQNFFGFKIPEPKKEEIKTSVSPFGSVASPSSILFAPNKSKEETPASASAFKEVPKAAPHSFFGQKAPV
jgi:hypothetical protein